MADIVEFLRIAYDYMNECTFNIGGYVFSFAGILRTEILIYAGLAIVDAFWHLGSITSVISREVN